MSILKEFLIQITADGNLTTTCMRDFTSIDWRSWIEDAPEDIKSEVESFFIFCNSHVHAVDEGYEADGPVDDLYQRALVLISKLSF